MNKPLGASWGLNLKYSRITFIISYHTMSDELYIIDTLGNTDLAAKYLEAESTAAENAGVDVFCPEDIIISPKSLATTIDFKIVCALTVKGDYSAYYLYPRSSISKTPLRMSNSIGLIDKGYRGHIMAKVDNLSDSPYLIRAGERLFQICAPNLKRPTVCLGAVSTDTIRGAGGFGSTGK